jgi:deoxyribonuclease-4
MITFAPGGNSDSFSKKKFPQDLLPYLESFGLNGYEFECGRGVRISEMTYKFLPEMARDNGICLSLHAPYFISLSSVNEETRLKSVTYILESARAAKRLGAEKIVVHSGSCANITREKAAELAKDTLKLAQNSLDENDLSDIIICPETMGKINQLGTLEEVLEFCTVSERFLPCVDFGHLNARTHGGIRTKQDYADIFDKCESVAGKSRTSQMHIHFSKILYTAGGEQKHLTFSDLAAKQYGPDYEFLLQVIKERGYCPSIVCESQGTQAEDAAVMRSYYESLKERISGGSEEC